jgi:hypothetical protein
VGSQPQFAPVSMDMIALVQSASQQALRPWPKRSKENDGGKNA